DPQDASASSKFQSLREDLANIDTQIEARQKRKQVAVDLERQARVSRTSGFWSDLFSNAGGAGLHRVQFGMWTLVLMAVFIYTVFHTLAMPNLDGTLLALMGVSAGAYAGLKVPEKK